MTPDSAVFRRAVWLAAGLVAVAHAASAQTPGPDPAAIWTLQDENASISGSGLTDRYYVNGLRLGYTSPENAVPPANRLSDWLFGGGAVRLSFDLSQQIFTPANTEAAVPPPGDRPYAGVLLGTLGLLRDGQDDRTLVALSLGLVGPGAGGEQLQNGFHDLIGQGHNNGWSTQLHNEPLGELTAARTWRFATGSVGALETDLLPDIALGLGNERVYGQGGLIVRLGQGLASDYGVARVAPGPSGWDAYKPTRPFVWYVFGGADAQAVGHDITLNGNDFRSGPSVEPKHVVAELEAGVGLIAWGARLTYTQVFQTQEFEHQKGGLHEFGSLALSVRF